MSKFSTPHKFILAFIFLICISIFTSISFYDFIQYSTYISAFLLFIYLIKKWLSGSDTKYIHIRNINYHLTFKILFVFLFIIYAPDTYRLNDYLKTISTDDLYFVLIFIPMVMMIVILLQKWFAEHGICKIINDKFIGNNNRFIEEKLPINKKYLIILNSAFLAMSLAYSMVVIDLASLQGAGRAQGEMIYILPALFSLLPIGVSIYISYKYFNKLYLFRGIVAWLLIPFVCFVLEDYVRYLFYLGFGYIISLIFATIITTYIFFSPSFAHLFSIYRKEASVPKAT